MSKKGSIVLSEMMLETTAILISFILIVLVVQLVFSQQNQRTYESVFESLTRDISTSIDRAAAAAGNIQMQLEIPKGMRFRLDIDQKALILKYGDKSSVRTFFSSLIKSGPYSFENPKSLCIIKTINDNRVFISNKTCSCKPNDGICDPECNVESKCDPKCVNDNTTGTCNPFCASRNPNLCDRNCYKGYKTGVCMKSCIKENERDGMCSPDCENIKKGVCDLDCYDQYSNGKTGYCDPDCPPKGLIITINGTKYKQSDGKCYTGCINSSKTTQMEKLMTACDSQDQKNWQCLIISKTGDYTSTNWTDYSNEIWSCGEKYTWCAGELCDEVNGNIACHVTTVNQKMFPDNFVCCCTDGSCRISTRAACLGSGGFTQPANSTQCSGQAVPQVINKPKIRLPNDGVCDLDCKDSTNICDPDCPDSPACQNVCAKENETAAENPCCQGLFACPGENICRKDCCGNGFCEWRPGTPNGWLPGNKIRWETNLTCSKDCGTHTQPSCQAGGTFTSSVCYEDVFDSTGRRIGDKPSWQPKTISVCDEEAKKFLDRRNWDINEVIKTIRANTPEGWAFDASRYIRACQRNQEASFTVAANENYTRDDYTCCCLTECPDDRATYIGAECCGIGYCADHASAVLSILRTLGIPDKDAYITFDIAGDCRRHAFALMKCDSDLKNKPGLWPTECNGNDNRWLRLDATGHFVTFVDDASSSCDLMCIWWNDKGLYPLIPQSEGGGKINDQSGYAIPQGVRCGGNNWDPSNSRCKQTNVECQVDKLCSLAGAPQNFTCIIPS